MSRARSVLAIAAIAIGVAACSRAKKAPPTAARVVSLSPSTTEAMFAIGAGAALVGRSRYCDYPPEALALPQVGGYVDPSLEAILALRPDLVTGARGPIGTSITDALATHGTATFFPSTESIADIESMVRGLGARTGHDAEADGVARAIEARVAAVGASVASRPKTRVLLVFGLSPISVAGPRSFPDEMIARAGGANVVSKGGAYPSMGIEEVLALDPDVVVDAAMGEAQSAERMGPTAAGWRDVRAVKNGHVVALKDEAILRPGPRVGDGIAILARALHPEVTIP